ncbi:MAG TPA: hypothetical protein PK671_13430, partial [Candidatus Obscuribacter sp.]|nr:hypothetical protein [Candidatus Obscuribacter sp.]
MAKKLLTLAVYLFLAVFIGLRCYDNYVGHMILRARDYISCGQWRQAIVTYNHLLNLFPGNAEFLARRGAAYAGMGNFKQAFVDLSDALKADSNCATAYSRRAAVYRRLGRRALAKADVETALSMMKEPPEAPDLLMEHANLLLDT